MLAPSCARVLADIRAAGAVGITTDDLAIGLGQSRTTVLAHVRMLIRRGLVTLAPHGQLGEGIWIALRTSGGSRHEELILPGGELG